MRSFMPYNAPGKLSKQQYAHIMACILKLNGIAPDGKALTCDGEALQKVLLALNPKHRIDSCLCCHSTAVTHVPGKAQIGFPSLRPELVRLKG